MSGRKCILVPNIQSYDVTNATNECRETATIRPKMPYGFFEFETIEHNGIGAIDMNRSV